MTLAHINGADPYAPFARAHNTVQVEIQSCVSPCRIGRSPKKNTTLYNTCTQLMQNHCAVTKTPGSPLKNMRDLLEKCGEKLVNFVK